MKREEWHKSKASNANGNCVEVMETADGSFLMRDTKDQEAGPVLRFTGSEWSAFLSGVRNGEFEPSSTK